MDRFDYKRTGKERLLEGGGSGGGYKTSGSKFNTAMDIAGGVAPVAAATALMGKYYMERKKDKSDKESEAELKRESRGKENMVLKTDSRAQYEHEKEAGDPNALTLSFEQWKKL